LTKQYIYSIYIFISYCINKACWYERRSNTRSRMPNKKKK